MSVFLRGGGREHDVRIVQLHHAAEPGVRVPARPSDSRGSAGGSGAPGQEIPGDGHSGAASPHRTHQNPPAEEEQEKLKTRQTGHDLNDLS